MESFKVFDIDNSGAIDPQNIKEVLSRLGSTLTDEEVHFLLNFVTWAGSDRRRGTYII